MKRYQLMLDKFQAEKLFSVIRSKKDIVCLWMNTIKIFLTHIKPERNEEFCSLILLVDKMSRLFIVSDGKAVSVKFPFFVQDNEEGVSFSSYSHVDINSMISSDILSLVEARDIFTEDDIFKFADSIWDVNKFHESIWCVFRDLMLCDDGYIRYDYDQEREDGDRHPLNHLDIFYSQASTFKLGLRNKVTIEYLEDILNTKTNCHYLGR